MLNKSIDSVKEGQILKNIKINESKSRQIKTIAASIFILWGVQGIEPSKVLAFDVIPLEAVSTTILSSIEFPPHTVWNDTFQVNVSDYSGLDSMAKLVGFTVLFTPLSPDFVIPKPIIYTVGTPLGWELSETGSVPQEFCARRFGGLPPLCETVLLPTLTFQTMDLDYGVSPGKYLDGFSVGYGQRCGVYPCVLQQSVIAVSSVPEPVTILGSAIALGFGINLKRKYSKTDSHKT